mmetsp:Transcript_100673/g.252396  ORF Transcript_100673/g.252396 Transcript_100673/m.252396 type:complete len:260 (+) Transcript_100673:3077-3856(+)
MCLQRELFPSQASTSPAVEAQTPQAIALALVLVAHVGHNPVPQRGEVLRDLLSAQHLRVREHELRHALRDLLQRILEDELAAEAAALHEDDAHAEEHATGLEPHRRVADEEPPRGEPEDQPGVHVRGPIRIPPEAENLLRGLSADVDELHVRRSIPDGRGDCQAEQELDHHDAKPEEVSDDPQAQRHRRQLEQPVCLLGRSQQEEEHSEEGDRVVHRERGVQVPLIEFRGVRLLLAGADPHEGEGGDRREPQGGPTEGL